LAGTFDQGKHGLNDQGSIMNKLFGLFLCGLILISTQSLTAQNEFSKWYFGQQAGLDFSTSPPTALTKGVIIAAEGAATISDPAGSLLFYAVIDENEKRNKN
jgi:hypothetical protein